MPQKRQFLAELQQASHCLLHTGLSFYHLIIDPGKVCNPFRDLYPGIHQKTVGFLYLPVSDLCCSDLNDLVLFWFQTCSLQVQRYIFSHSYFPLFFV